MIKKVALGAAGLVFLILLIPEGTKDNTAPNSPQVLGTQTENPVITQPEVFLKPSPELARDLALPELNANSVLAFDLDSGAILYTKNFDQELPVASLTKLMTALVVVDRVRLDEIVEVKREDTLVIGSNMGLVPGEKISVIDLLHGMLIPSSNDASMALARYVAGSVDGFVDLMNQKGQELGLTNSHFSNPVGLDSNDNYSTAFDLGKVVTEFVKHPELARIVQLKQLQVVSADQKFSHVLTSTNQLLLEDETVMGIKTGFTDEAKGNLIIRKKQGSAEVISIVLNSDDREADSRNLLNWIFAAYLWYN